MKLKELKLSNFLSHADTKIVFQDNEKVLLDGKSGSGKSSITEAILWVLFGKGRSDNRSLIRRGTKAATVSLKLDDGKHETFITRSVSNTGKNTLNITQNIGSNGQFIAIERTGLKDLQDWIEKEFLKTSYELFTNSIAYPQENENSFVKTSASRRKDLLLEIIGAVGFDELYEKTRKIIISSNLEENEIVTKIKLLESTIQESKEIESQYDFYKTQSEKLSIEISTYQRLEKDLQDQLSNISNILNQIENKESLKKALSNNLVGVQTQIEQKNKTIKQYESIDIDLAKKKVIELNKVKEQILKIEEEIKQHALSQSKINAHLANKPNVHDHLSDIEGLKRRLEPLIKDSVSCPSGDKCPFTIPIKGQIDFLEEQIREKTKLSEEEKRVLEIWEQEYVLLVPTKDVSGLYVELKNLRELKDKTPSFKESEDIVNNYETFQEIIKDTNKQVVELEKEQTKIISEITTINEILDKQRKEFDNYESNKINSELSKTKIQLQKLTKERDEVVSNLALATKAKEVIKKSSSEITLLKKKETQLKEECSNLELLKEALSPRGVKAVVIDYLVPQLEDRINEILNQMSDFRIKLDTQKETVSGDGLKEGLFITVLNDRGEELPFESYSGGEKVKITVAISEALSGLQNHIGFRIMDENIISLDTESTEGFVEVLTQLQSKFPQLIIISHLPEVKDIFEKHIKIIKTNGISRVI